MSSHAPPVDRVERREPPLQGARERPLERMRGKWGMWLFIATEGMLFAMLFFAYGYLGASRPEWPPEKDPSLKYALILLGILIVSSVVLHWAERGIKRGQQMRFRVGLAITLLLGVVFLVVQRFEYVHHLHSLTPGMNAYGSIFFTITSFHLAHLVIGMLMLSHVTARALAGHFSERKHLAVENTSLYWHFVDLVWLFVVGILYVSPHLYD